MVFDTKRLDDLYIAYKVYLKRKRDMYNLLADSEGYHDDSIDLLSSAYDRACEKSDDLKSRFLAELEMLDDEEGYYEH